MPSVLPLSAKAWPTSTTSGARSWLFRVLMAVISSALDPSGLASVIVMPYFFWKLSISSP